MDWIVHGVTKSQTWLSDFHFHFHGGGLVPKLCTTLLTLWTVAHQAPLSMGLYRQEYWSGLPCHPPETVQHCSSWATELYDLFILHQFLPGYPLTLQPHLQQEPQIPVLISLCLINQSFFLFSDDPANYFQWWDQVGSCISKPEVQGLVRIIGWAAWGRSDGLVLWL